jgi:hypothetical protein
VAVSLDKHGVAVGLSNRVAVKCPRCDQSYQLSYSDDEWNRLKDWLRVAERVLREDHKQRHELPSPTLKWNPVRGR